MRAQYSMMMLVVLVVGCKPTIRHNDKPVIEVSTYQVEAAETSQSRSFKGLVMPADLTPISFRIAGELEVLTVKEGDRVKKGQLVARLDKRKVQQKVNDSQAQYNLAKKQYQRGKDLLSKKLISKAEFDELLATMQL